MHRWAPYIQGFAAAFVQSILDQYKDDYTSPVILDPFVGCGIVLAQSKLNGYKSVGTELNPLIQFIDDTKVDSWDIAPEFLKSENQFNEGVLKNLELLKGGIDSILTKTKEHNSD